MTKVIVRDGKLENALKTFKQKNVKSGHLKKARERQEGYLKPGVQRRLKEEAGIKNNRRKNKSERSYN